MWFMDLISVVVSPLIILPLLKNLTIPWNFKISNFNNFSLLDWLGKKFTVFQIRYKPVVNHKDDG